MKIVSMADEMETISELVLRPQPKAPDDAWATFMEHMRVKHGVTDIESSTGQAYMAIFDRYPPMKALLDYMMRRTDG
jgi:hypothetical protein